MVLNGNFLAATNSLNRSSMSFSRTFPKISSYPGPNGKLNKLYLMIDRVIMNRLVLLITCIAQTVLADDGVWVRFRLNGAPPTTYYVEIAGMVHKPNWYLPTLTVPTNATRSVTNRFRAGTYTDWVDLRAWAGTNLHGRLNLAGGIAEFPNITARFVVEPTASSRDIQIELATGPDERLVVKRWRESFAGETTSFLVSPNLREDAGGLEIASEMTARRARWAKEATGGARHAPKELLLQTSFWGPQRPDLNIAEARTLWLLGFNVVGGMGKEVRAAFPEFRAPGASHDVLLGPESDVAAVKKIWDRLEPQLTNSLQPRAPFNFQDEICSRPPIGDNASSRQAFHVWLKERKLRPEQFGVAKLDDVEPIETPVSLKERMKINEPAARRVFYYTSRFRQEATTERLHWNSEELHRRFGTNFVSSTLLADHPYFSGTGLGMGMDEPNDAWGGWHLAADWFDIARRHAVDLVGIEDWLGLQFMYGPDFTWEGFQLMGFQANMIRSASRGSSPVIAWITPSDERNLRLKAMSSLCQGAKNFYYWTYGPTATSTENYWSDQRGSYPGMAALSRALEFGESIIAPGRPRPTRVALLYSISSDLWQPFGYAHMLERRGLYFALTHDQYLVDMLTEEDVAAGRLADYRVLYTADPCIRSDAAKTICRWVETGGTLVATCAAGSRNEFGEPTADWAGLLGIAPQLQAKCQPGNYRMRGRLNDIKPADELVHGTNRFPITGVQVSLQPARAKVDAAFAGANTAALLRNRVGGGQAITFAGTPGISYIREARFVRDTLAEKWPPAFRRLLTQFAAEANAPRLVELSEPVVEAGAYDSPEGTALILVNFTYQPISSLRIEIPASRAVTAVTSCRQGSVPFENVLPTTAWKNDGYKSTCRFAVPLDLDDVIVLKQDRRNGSK
jgi:hypothetical protein